MSYPLDSVGSALQNPPTHHVKLADAAGNKVLLRLQSGPLGDGKNKTIYDDMVALTRTTVPQQAIRMTGQGGEYADLQPPWQAYEQSTWEGGRGKRYFHQDKTRYAEMGRLLTQVENQVTMAGLPAYTGGQLGGDAPHEDYALMPNDSSTLINYLNVYGSARYVARQFTPAYTFDCNAVILPLALIGTAPGGVRVDLYSDSGSNAPNTSLANATLTASDFGTEETFRQFRLDLSTTVTLTAGTLYWFVVRSVTDGTSSHYWQVLSEATTSTSAKQSSNGALWSAVSPYRAPCVILCDANNSALTYKYFTYKGQLYALKNLGDGTSFSALFMNGWRGAADSNAGQLNKLIDATQTGWSASIPNTTGIVLITKGPGADEAQPWRRIVGSASGELTVSPSWLTPHTTATEYVVLGSNYWFSKATLFYAVDSVVSVGEYAYLTQGSAVMRRWREYNNGGTWTAGSSSEVISADRLITLPDPTNGKPLLFGYSNKHALGPVYWRMNVPPAVGALYRPLGTILPTNIPWNDYAISNVTQSVGETGTKVTIAAGFSTGYVAVKDLADPLTLAEGQSIGVMLKSSVAIGAGELVLNLSSRPWLQQQDHKRLANYVYHRTVERYQVAASVSTLNLSTGAHTNKAKMYDGLDDTTDTLPLTTTEALCLIFDEPVASIRANISVANTTTPLTLTLSYFNGEEFVSHAITASGNFGGVANTPFGATGKQTISFVPPEDIAPYTANSATGYAYLIECSGTLLASTAIKEFAGKNAADLVDAEMVYAHEAYTTNPYYLTLAAGDKVMIGMADKFDGVYITMGSTVNAVTATMSAEYFDGEKWTTLTVTDGTATGGKTLAQSGEVSFTPPKNWQALTFDGKSAYWVALSASAALTEEIQVSEISVYLTETVHTIDCAMNANEWTWVVGSITPGSSMPEGMVVRNLTLWLKADLGAQTLEMKDGVQLLATYPEYRPMSTPANNIVAYGQGDQLLAPHLLFPNQRPHRVDMLNNDALIPILVTAMETIADESNGKAACHSGVYLYFNMANRLMRYFEGSLESVGPDLDEGLPHDRQGVISCVIPYAGDQVIYAVNAGVRDPLFTSAVYLRAGSGVHELYRAPVGESVDHLQIQVVPGVKSDRLWIAVGAQLIHVPISSYTRDPLKDLEADGDSNYYYLHDGYLDEGYYSDGALGLNKVFVSAVLVTRNLSASNRYLELYYRVDDATTWTKVTTQITTSPVQEVKLATGYVTGKKLQLRVRAYNWGGVKNTPVIEAIYVKGLTIYPATYAYNLTALVGDYLEDLDGRKQTHLANVDLAQLDSWRNAGTPLTMSNLMTAWDTRSVVLNAIDERVAVLDVDSPEREQYLISMNLMDITI